MTTFGEAIGRAVISRETAEQVGVVRRLLVDPASGRIPLLAVADLPRPIVTPMAAGPAGAGLMVDVDDGEVPVLLDWADVVGFGPDAVLIPSAAAIRPVRTDGERQFAAGFADLTGRRLLTADGTLLGQVSDVEFDETAGTLIGLLAGDVRIPVDRLVAVGPYAVIIAA